MQTDRIEKKKGSPKEDPLCPVFGECRGCSYQDISYSDELRIKTDQLKSLFQKVGDFKRIVFEPIIASPNPYHYRHRLDLVLKKTRDYGVVIGFSTQRHHVISIDQCPIALKDVSDFIPELKAQAIAKLPEKYRMASLVVKTGDDGRLFWGGIGKKSLRLQEKDYLWTNVLGRKIFYSLDTFFQANLSILPELMKHIRSLDIWSEKATLFDLYGGVGLFGLSLADKVKKVVLVEEVPASIEIAKYNVKHHKLNNFEIVVGRVEDELPNIISRSECESKIAFIDPPRAGLKDSARDTLSDSKKLNYILYLSCNPETLVDDLVVFTQRGWEIQKVWPCDFFPKTKHLETLVLLKSQGS